MTYSKLKSRIEHNGSDSDSDSDSNNEDDAKDKNNNDNREEDNDNDTHENNNEVDNEGIGKSNNIDENDEEDDDIDNVPIAVMCIALDIDFMQNIDLPYFGCDQPGELYYYTTVNVNTVGIVDCNNEKDNLHGYFTMK